MDTEVKEIVDAINNIGTTNIVKDYIFPLAIILLGGFVAHFSTAYMRYLDAQKEKLDIANDWILGLHQAFTSLIALKSNYMGKLTEAPLQRAGAFPQIINSSQSIELPINKLSFIVQTENEFFEEYNFHMNPSYISGLQSNYNLLISILQQRNILASQILPILGENFSTQGTHVDASLDEIFKVVNPPEFLGYIQITEQIIKLTDELLIAIHNFLCEFPDICRYSIDIDRVKHYRKIIVSHYDHMELLEKSVPVNYGTLAELFNLPEEQVVERFSTGYENQSEPIEKTTQMIKNLSVNQAIERHKLNESIKRRHRYWWLK